MTETRKRNRKAETVEDLDAKIAEMEAELHDGYGEPLTWEQVTTTTADELARKEQRRGILPRLLHAAKVKRQELEVLRREREAAPLREKLEASYVAFQEQEEALRQAKERRNAAHTDWVLSLTAVQSADERTKRAERELDELQEGGR